MSERDDSDGACMYCVHHATLGMLNYGVCLLAVRQDLAEGRYEGLSIEDIVADAMSHHDVDGWSTPCERYEEA